VGQGKSRLQAKAVSATGDIDVRGKEAEVVGISSFGFYVPAYRLSRNEIARAWKTRGMGGERAVAKYDEDSLTMAACAALDCQKCSRATDGLFFASTTSPYEEKQAASILASITDVNSEARTADFTGSLRAGTLALGAAVDAVRAGSLESVIVTVADARMGAVKSNFEQQVGDGAAAFSIGTSETIAEFESAYSVYSELYDTWRLKESTFVQSWEERFTVSEGYMNAMEKAISGIMRKCGLPAGDFAKVVLSAPDKRSHTALVRRLGLDQEHVQDPLFDFIGNAGAAALPIMLVAALSQAEPGERILVANHGDGADAFVLRVTGRAQDRQDMTARMTKKIYIDYERYLAWRQLVSLEQPRRPELRLPAVPCLWRERKSVMALYGSRCRQCGTVQYPPQRICVKCHAKDDFEHHKLSDKKGTIFTYAFDSLTSAIEQPAIIGVVDFDGGGRLVCEVADCEASEIKIGMPVEMTVRKVGRTDSIQNYFWKAKPVS
jgi:3-hydroxy-3-methylglutaryl CoA synthase